MKKNTIANSKLKNNMKLFKLFIIAILMCTTVRGQIIYDFASGITAIPTSLPAGITNATGITQFNSFITTINGAGTPASLSPFSGAGNGNFTAKTVPLSSTLSTYAQVILTPTTNNWINISSISLANFSLLTTGPLLLSIRTSLDNFAADVTSSPVATSATLWNAVTFNLTTPIVGLSSTPLTLRIYASGGSGTAPTGTTAANANWRIDDLKITATLGSPSNGSIPKYSSPSTFTNSVITESSAGNIGIGTSTPLAKLHLLDGSFLTSGVTGGIPLTGAGTRMMWVPSKAAFRAGVVQATQWDNSLLGQNSTAFGINTTASGNASIATGNSTSATGNFSTAMGGSTSATGDYSTAIGATANASGLASTAIGYNIFSKAIAATTIGELNDNTDAPTATRSATDRLFQIGNGDAITSNRSNALTVLRNGNIGVGITTPTEKLQIGNAGNIQMDAGSLVFKSLNPLNTSGRIRMNNSNNSNFSDIYNPSLNPTSQLAFTVGSGEAMRMDGAGNIGIATTSPSEKLDVIGNIKFSGALMPNNLGGALGQILTSGGGGQSPTWQNLPSTTATAWGLSGNAGTNSTTNFIGTTDNNDVVFKRNNIQLIKFSNANNVTIGSSNNIATSQGAIALGSGTTSSNINSTAMGSSTTASGIVSTAMGASTTASGIISTAMGGSTTASAYYSTAMGFFTESKSYGNLAIGLYNDNTPAPSSFATNPLNRIFEIGNGSNTVRSNAMTVLYNGNVGVGTTTPTKKLEINVNELSTINIESKKPIVGVSNMNFIFDANRQGGTEPIYPTIGIDNIGGITYHNDGNIVGPGFSSNNKLLWYGYANNDSKSFRIAAGENNYGNFSLELRNNSPAFINTGNYWIGQPNSSVLAAWNHQLNIGSYSSLPVKIFSDGGTPNKLADIFVQNSRVGIGTETPNSNAKLDVNGNIISSGVVAIGSVINWANITGNADPNKNYKLAVNGNAIFEKVTVKLYSNWPDYVFNKNYDLPSLKTIETFINNNKHLPGVPSADEVKKEGIDLGDNQAILLKKVEELTLYIIEQNKKIEKLEAEKDALKNLQKQIDELKALILKK